MLSTGRRTSAKQCAYSVFVQLHAAQMPKPRRSRGTDMISYPRPSGQLARLAGQIAVRAAGGKEAARDLTRLVAVRCEIPCGRRITGIRHVGLLCGISPRNLRVVEGHRLLRLSATAAAGR